MFTAGGITGTFLSSYQDSLIRQAFATLHQKYTTSNIVMHRALTFVYMYMHITSIPKRHQITLEHVCLLDKIVIKYVITFFQDLRPFFEMRNLPTSP